MGAVGHSRLQLSHDIVKTFEIGKSGIVHTRIRTESFSRVRWTMPRSLANVVSKSAQTSVRLHGDYDLGLGTRDLFQPLVVLQQATALDVAQVPVNVGR